MCLDSEEKRHLEICPGCREYYDSILFLQKNLQETAFEPLSAREFTSMQDSLNKKINQFQMRTASFYKYSLRLGTALMTAVLLFLVSLWSGFDNGIMYSDQAEQVNGYYYTDNGFIDDETIDDNYLDLILDDYTIEKGFNSGESLLGELTADEFDYLENNFDMGDIL
jgi:hypothetical protein